MHEAYDPDACVGCTTLLARITVRLFSSDDIVVVFLAHRTGNGRPATLATIIACGDEPIVMSFRRVSPLRVTPNGCWIEPT